MFLWFPLPRKWVLVAVGLVAIPAGATLVATTSNRPHHALHVLVATVGLEVLFGGVAALVALIPWEKW